MRNPLNEAATAIYLELRRRQDWGEINVSLSEESIAFLKESSARGKPDSIKPMELAHSPKNQSEADVAASGRKEIPDPPSLKLTSGDANTRLKELQLLVAADTWCQSQLSPGKRIVFGDGNPSAEILFCGEAPGAEEEIAGTPFVGAAGQLLNKVIQAMGLGREDVYIANIMSYRPPISGGVGNRAPTEAEMRYCLPYFLAQLEIVNPKVVVALGRTAVDGLLGFDRKRKMTQFRGKWQSFKNWKVMPTFHPSYLLRNESLSVKRQVWEDMMEVMREAGIPISDKQKGFFLR